MDLKRVTIPATGAVIAYDAAGPKEAPGLLLIPGGGGEARASTFASIWERFTDSYRVVIVEGRGAPLADKGPEGFTTADMARDYVGLLDILGVDRTYVMGGSLGSMIGQHVCADLGSRLLGAVLFIAGPGGSPFCAQLTSHLSRVAMTDFREYLLGAFIWGYNPEEFNELWPVLRNNLDTKIPEDVILGVARRYMAVANHDARARLREIEAPVLVIAAENDKMMPAGYCRELADGLPNAEYRVIPGGSHMFSSLNTEDFYQTTRKFLERVKP